MDSLKALATRLLQWLREVDAWFFSARFFWLTLLIPPVVAVVAFWLFSGPPKGLKVAAMVLEVGGLWVVGRGLLRQQQRFDPLKRTLWTRAKGYFGTFPPPWGRKPISGDSAAVLEGSEMRASAGAVTPWSAMTLEQRVEVLAAEIEVIEGNVANLTNWQAEIRDRLTQEEQKRLSADERAARDVVELATGDLPAQAIGWVWLVFGAVLHGIP